MSAVLVADDGSGWVPTWVNFYIAADGTKVACTSGDGFYKTVPMGTDLRWKTFRAKGKPPHPVCGEFQRTGIAAGPNTRTIVLDGDHLEQLTPQERALLEAIATSVADDQSGRLHVKVIVPDSLLAKWPRQATGCRGVDIKSAGFCYDEGWNAGRRYVPTGRPPFVATPMFMDWLLQLNGGKLHEDSGGALDDDFEAMAASWTDPDGAYPEHLGEAVLGGDWAEGTRNGSLPWRCGIVKAAGEIGHPGMASLLRELERAYKTETNGRNVDMSREFGRAYPAWGKVGELAQDAWTVNVPGFDPDTRDAAVLAAAPAVPPAGIVSDAEAHEWAKAQDPARFFSAKDGLMAMELAKAVRSMGPVAKGADDLFWRYRGGVWVPDKDVVSNRTARLLKDMHRTSYAGAVKDIVRALAPEIRAEPVERFVNVPNGLLDWRTGQLLPHDPDVMSTVQLAVPWQPGATCPQFEAWLAQVLPPDCTELAWELIGYLAYSGNPLHTAVMLTGGGRNGKGTFLRIVTALLGRANVTSVSLPDLVNARFAAASLFGKIANISGDIDATYLENTAKLKAITGGDMVSAEHKGRDLFDFTPWAVPVFSANKIPASADTTSGYLSRWLILPFPVSFEGREDRTVDARLHAELPGILAGGLRRLPRLLARGRWALGDSATEAKAQFERHVDQVRAWVHECCETGQGLPHVNRAELFSAYQRWAYADGGKPVKASEFYDRLNRLAHLGIRPAMVHGQRGYHGVRVVKQDGASAWTN